MLIVSLIASISRPVPGQKMFERMQNYSLCEKSSLLFEATLVNGLNGVFVSISIQENNERYMY